MAKQLSNTTGKGFLLAKGQEWVESYLSDHTQRDLAELANFISNGKPNAGAVSVALKSLGWASFNGQSPAVTAKTGDKPSKPAETVKKESAEPVMVPGRVSDFFEDNVDGYTVGTEITPAMVEEVILSDSTKWNQRIMKFGPKEIEGLGEFLVSGGFCPVARVSQRAEWEREQIKLAEKRRIAEAVAAIAAIDTRLANQRERFESSRFDADITAFYAA